MRLICRVSNRDHGSEVKFYDPLNLQTVVVTQVGEVDVKFLSGSEGDTTDHL